MRFAFSNAMAEGTQTFHTYAPWRDEDDEECILFASVQGFGPKSPGYAAPYVYPGSGATGDSKRPPAAALGELATAPAEALDAGEETDVEEDPEHEFASRGLEPLPTEGPRVINVGVPGATRAPTPAAGGCPCFCR